MRLAHLSEHIAGVSWTGLLFHVSFSFCLLLTGFVGSLHELQVNAAEIVQLCLPSRFAGRLHVEGKRDLCLELQSLFYNSVSTLSHFTVLSRDIIDAIDVNWQESSAPPTSVSHCWCQHEVVFSYG